MKKATQRGEVNVITCCPPNKRHAEICKAALDRSQLLDGSKNVSKFPLGGRIHNPGAISLGNAVVGDLETSDVASVDNSSSLCSPLPRVADLAVQKLPPDHLCLF